MTAMPDTARLAAKFKYFRTTDVADALDALGRQDLTLMDERIRPETEHWSQFAGGDLVELPLAQALDLERCDAGACGDLAVGARSASSGRRTMGGAGKVHASSSTARTGTATT